MTAKLKVGIAFILGLILVISAGQLWTYSLGPRLRQRLEKTLEANNDLVIASINPERYANLSFSDADRQNPEYASLYEQFQTMGRGLKSYYGIRGIYAMKSLGDKILCIVDSAPVDDSFHCEPGVVYDEPPQVLLDVIRDGQPRVYGPYTDELGTFYSAFALQYDKKGEVVASMGTDIEATDYTRMLNDGLLLARLVAMMAVLTYILFFFMMTRLSAARHQKRERELDELRRIKEREKMLMNIGEGVVAFDKSNKMIFANKFAVESVCQGDLDCAGQEYRSHWSLFDERGKLITDAGQDAASSDESMAAKRLPHLKRHDGELFPVAVTRVNLELGPESPASVMTFRDITREVEIDRMKSDFVGMAAHQLQNPLTALRWSVEALSDAAIKRTAAEKQAVENIVGVTQRLNGLVIALLNITRIESGRLTIEPKPTDIAMLAAEVIKENALAAQAKKQDVVLVSETGLPKINVDPLLVREIFKNLLTNSIKYTPNDGRIDVRIETDGSEIVSSVKDNGFGIPVDDQKRVFDQFFRATNVVRKSEDGTGLGLYLAKQIVKNSGGRIWFESTEGVGSTFYFSLPSAGSPAKQGKVRIS